MKRKLSITLDEETVENILKTISSGKFRNKSHVVEYAVKKLLEENQSPKDNSNEVTLSQFALEVKDG